MDVARSRLALRVLGPLMEQIHQHCPVAMRVGNEHGSDCDRLASSRRTSCRDLDYWREPAFSSVVERRASLLTDRGSPVVGQPLQDPAASQPNHIASPVSENALGAAVPECDDSIHVNCIDSVRGLAQKVEVEESLRGHEL